MEDWITYKLSDFININPPVRLKANQKYSFVEMRDLDASLRTVRPSDFKILKGGAKFQNRDTLFARITPCLQNGKICQVKELQNNFGFGSTEFLVFRGKEGVSDTDFVYYLSREPFVRQFAETNMIGTSGRQRVVKEAFQNIQLELPPLPVQKSIASILSALDDKIELNLHMNKTLEEMAMALYKHWFVDFGPFQNGKFVESELGMIPYGWEVKQLEQIVDVGSSNRIFLNEYVDNGIPFYRGKEIIELSKGVNISTELFISYERYEKIKRKAGVPGKDDILISSVGTIGISWLVEDNNPFYFKDGNLTWIKNYDKQVNGHFISLWLKSDETQNQIKSETIGSTQQALTISALKKLKVILPPSNSSLVQDVTQNFVFWHDLFLSNKNEIKTLTALRDTLLPKLISGQIRVKDAEQMVAASL